MSKNILLIASFLLTYSCWSRATDLPLLRIKTRVLDSKLPLVQVGGERTLGLVAGDPSAQVNLRSLIALVPEHSKGALCARLTSKDGQFKVALGYDVQHVQTGEYRLEFSSGHLKELESLRSDQLAVVLWLADSCQATIPDGPEYVLAKWQPNADLHSIYLYENAGRLSARLVDLAGKQVGACESLLGRSVSFNTQCQYPIAQGKKQALNLELLHFGSVQDTIPVSFVLP